LLSVVFLSSACLSFSLFFSVFFPWVGGQFVQRVMAQGCLWEYWVLLSSPSVLLFPSRLGAGIWRVRALLVSLFNVEWECYAWAGSVDVSEFCFFLVVGTARCISSVSPGFYFTKNTFCFLPLVAI
jgi:hypothetical protein